jgi:hypothetical protein
MSRAKLLSFASGRTAGVLPYSICVMSGVSCRCIFDTSLLGTAANPCARQMSASAECQERRAPDLLLSGFPRRFIFDTSFLGTPTYD